MKLGVVVVHMGTTTHRALKWRFWRSFGDFLIFELKSINIVSLDSPQNYENLQIFSDFSVIKDSLKKGF